MPQTSIQQAVRNAIEAELSAARFYQLLADSTKEVESRKFLEEMAQCEREHARQIEEAGRAIAEKPLPEHADMDVSMIETLPEWKFVDDIPLAAAFDLAVAAENQAALTYDALADFLEEPAATFFRGLSQQEERHAELLREKRAALGL